MQNTDVSKLDYNELLKLKNELADENSIIRKELSIQNNININLKKHTVRSNQLAEMVRKIDVRHLNTIEEAATSGAAEIFNADATTLFLVDRDKVMLALKSSFPKQFKFPPMDLVNDSDVMLVYALRNCREPQIITNLQAYEIECGIEFRPHPTDLFFANGGMLLPLYYNTVENQTEIVGILALTGPVFSTDDISTAMVISEILATNLNNFFLLDKMSVLAETDGLTDLYNHRHFQQELTRAVASFSRYKTRFSFLMLDIDNFKNINDTYMHQTGDYILRELSRIIRQNLRENVDIASRYGGDEFALILPQTGLRGAKVVGERIKESIMRHRFTVGTECVHVTVSIGIAEFKKGINQSQLIESADYALYQAKHDGKNKIVTCKELTPPIPFN